MAITANEALRDALIRHQIYVLRYSGYVRNRVISILNSTEEDIAMRIRDKLRAGTGLETPAQVQRMQSLLDAVNALRRGAWEEANKVLMKDMEDLSIAEPQFAQGIFATTSPVLLETKMPPARQLRAIALSRPFEGALLKDWAQTMEADDIRRIHGQIQIGMISGEGTDKIVRRVIGSNTLDGTDGVTNMTRRQVTAITRTAVQHVANSSRNDFFQENADIITAELFVATLDSRTTAICRANDGKKFELGKGPRPPLHFQCRSLRIAAFDEEQIGKRPAKASTQKIIVEEYAEKNKLGAIKSRDDLPKGHKGKFDEFERKRIREMTGRVPASLSYNEWLKQQSHAFQNEVLGKTKADLFRGGLSLDKFVAANGSELSLSQIASLHANAFRAAGLDPKSFIN